jgi:hypothetical protein
LGVAAGLLTWSGSAQAAGLVGYCHAAVGSAYYFTEVIELPENTEYVSVHLRYERFVEDRVGKTPWDSRCDGFETREEAERMRSEYLGNLAQSGKSVTFLTNFPPDPGQASSSATSRSRGSALKTTNSASVPHGQLAKPKKTNAQADSEFAIAQAEYEKQLVAQEKQVEEYKRAQEEVARKKQEQKAAAEQAAADYQRQLEAHARTVRNQQLEYQKQVAKPVGVPNAVYRGFWAPDCDAARKSATLGAGTSTTTRFKEVTSEAGSNGCIVQGWWWNVAGGGTATRQ